MECTEARKFYEHVCELTGTEFDTSTVCYHRIENTKYHISIFHQKYYRNADEFHKVSLSLVWDNNVILDRQYLKIGSSDRVIKNRFNRLLEMAV